MRNLDVDNNADFSGLLFSSSSSSRAQLERRDVIQKAMPSILSIEVLSTADIAKRFEVERTSGPSDATDRVSGSPRDYAAVEAAMLKKNSKAAGYLVLLKRSLHSDPEWLDKRPMVLPHPKRWSEIKDGVSAAVVNSGTDVDTLELAIAVAEVEMEGPLVDTGSSGAGTNSGKKKLTPEQKAKVEATTKLMAFSGRATKIAKLAKAMCEFAGQNLLRFGDISQLADISTATHGFTKATITQREVDYYTSVSTGAALRALHEARVAREEAEPWELLRLPKLSVETISRWEKIREEKEIIRAKNEAALRRLLASVQHDPTAELIPREGREVIFDKNLEDMNLDQLRILVDNAGIPRKTEIKKKKASCIKAIKEFLRVHPEHTVRTLSGEEDEALIPPAPILPPATIPLAATPPAGIASPSPISTLAECVIQECTGVTLRH